MSEKEGGMPQVPYETQRFVYSDQAWDRIADAIVSLSENELHLEVKDGQPLLGDVVDGKDVEAYPSLKAAFEDPESTIELLADPTTQDIVGFSLAFPMQKFNPTWQGERAAYIYATALRQQDQGKGFVEHLVDPLYRDLAARGYHTAIRDAMVENGYAATIEKRFAGEGIITTSYEHNKFGLGHQKYFETNIHAYLNKIDSNPTK